MKKRIKIGDIVIVKENALEAVEYRDYVGVKGKVVHRYVCSGRLVIKRGDGQINFRIPPRYLERYIGVGHQLLLFGDL